MKAFFVRLVYIVSWKSYESTLCLVGIHSQVDRVVDLLTWHCFSLIKALILCIASYLSNYLNIVAIKFVATCTIRTLPFVYSAVYFQIIEFFYHQMGCICFRFIFNFMPLFEEIYSLSFSFDSKDYQFIKLIHF